MNPRTFHEEGEYYDLEPPWNFANNSVIVRISQLRRHRDRIFKSVNELESLYKECQKHGTDAITRTLDITRHILKLMESAEVFSYNFPELAEKSWWGGFTQDVAHAYWRIEEGRFEDAGSDEETLSGLLGEVADILENSTGASNSVLHQLSIFLDHYGQDLHPQDVPKKYESDVYEARDLYCLGYYSTSLMVLGRAVEKALLELGEVRKVKTIRTHGSQTDWRKARFYHRNIALNRIDMPDQHGKVLSEKEYHQIAILIDYRNNVAHSEYDQVGREEAHRQLMDAFDLLRELSEKIEYLQELDDDMIEPVEGQKAQ